MVPGCESIRQDQNEKAGGSCSTFARSNEQYQRVKIKPPLECLVVMVQANRRWVNIVNFYNHHLTINIRDLEVIKEQIGTPVFWVTNVITPLRA